jgi:hypothetical protein
MRHTNYMLKSGKETIRQRRKGKIDCTPHTISLNLSYDKEIVEEKMRNGKGKMEVQMGLGSSVCATAWRHFAPAPFPGCWPTNVCIFNDEPSTEIFCYVSILLKNPCLVNCPRLHEFSSQLKAKFLWDLF